MPSRRILFICHEASRTGAPMVLLHFLRWLRKNTQYDFCILLQRDGPLRADFEAVAPTTVYPLLQRRVKRNLIQRILRKAGLAYQADYRYNPLCDLYTEREIGLVYSNTVTNKAILHQLEYLKCPAIIHVHELEGNIRNSGETFGQLAGGPPRHFIAASRAVAQNLRARHGVTPAFMTVVHESIDVAEVQKHLTARNVIRRDLAIPEEAFVVGGSGKDAWRKGEDLFLALSVAMLGRNCIPDLHFVWVGEHERGLAARNVADDLKKTPWAHRVHFVGEVTNPYDYYSAFDVFAMVSREDPYPLVNLENAALGNPIVCFDKAGGTPEFVEADAGLVVPYLDLGAFEKALTTLAHDVTLRSRLGKRASEKVWIRHTVEVGAQEILAIIEKMIKVEEAMNG